MKTAGEILKNLFSEEFMKKAQGATALFDSWADITEKNGVAAAGEHSRIKDFKKGKLLIEIDHPGWKQILQTKQSNFLQDYQNRFPDLDIEGISFVLSNNNKT